MKQSLICMALVWLLASATRADDNFPADEFTLKDVTDTPGQKSSSSVNPVKSKPQRIPRKCWKCHGKGSVVMNVAETCDRCGGRKITEEAKEVEKTTWVRDWYNQLRPETRKMTVMNKQPCQQCRRTGRIYVKKEVECSACHGTGKQ